MSHACAIVVTDTKPTQETLEKTLRPWRELECTEINDEYVRENAKWDWWQIGGRYTGHLTEAYNPSEDPANQERCWLCRGTGKRPDMTVHDGCNGCHGTGISTKWPTQWVNVGNQARWGAIDFDALLQANRKVNADTWDKAEIEYKKRLQGKHTLMTFGDALRYYNKIIKTLQTEDSEEPLWQRIKNDPEANRFHALVGFCYGIENVYSRNAFIAKAVALSAWALVKDGCWYEKGALGWFGMSMDDKEDWPTQLQALLKTIRPDQWITIVDYHI